MKISVILYLLISLLCTKGFAQSNSLKSTNHLLIKSNLEEVVSSKWKQDLETIVDKKDFKISVNLDLKEKKNKDDSSQMRGPLYNDLELGFLDAEELLKGYNNKFDFARGESFLVRKASVKLGLAPTLSEEKINVIKSFLNDKIKNNFGRNGSLEISNFDSLEVSPFREPTLLEKLQPFQVFGGSALLALALIIGSLLFALSSRSSNTADSAASDLSASVNVNSNAEIAAGAGLEGNEKTAGAVATGVAAGEIADYRTRIREVSESLTEELDAIITEWCNQGEQGLAKLACFTEVASAVVGKVIIPDEHKSEISKQFSSMHKLDEQEKLSLFERTYWDLVASSNLGVSALHEPFSFISNASMDTLSDVLSKDDSRNQAIISMFMPKSSRESYIRDLEHEQKIEILTTAAKLSSVSEHELHQLEDSYSKHFDNKVDESEISMSQTLKKIVDALSMIDSCKMLPEVAGEVMNQYKTTFGHIAFVPQWKDESLSYLMKRATSEEIFAYLKVMPHMTDAILGFVAPKTGEIVRDDLANTSNTFNEKMIEENLRSLNNKILDIFSNEELKISDTIVKEENDEIKIAA